MAKNARHALPAKRAKPAPKPRVGDTVDLTPRQLTKQEFGRRLLSLLADKRWTQGDLHRASGVSRDAISTYVRGVSFPESANLHAIASAFGLTADTLLPNITESVARNDASPTLEIRSIPGDPDNVWLRINQKVSYDLAAKIMAMVKSDKA
jgi:transcriptional regulator with XRE-family HTH domain